MQVFRDTDRELANNYTVAMRAMMETQTWHQLKESMLGLGISCPQESKSDQVSLQAMYGTPALMR